MAKCITEICKNILSVHARVPDCPDCRAAYRYRSKMRPGKILASRNRFNMAQSRLDAHFDKLGKKI